MPTAILDDTLYCGFNIADNKKALLVVPKFKESVEGSLYHAKDMNDLRNCLGEYD